MVGNVGRGRPHRYGRAARSPSCKGTCRGRECVVHTREVLRIANTPVSMSFTDVAPGIHAALPKVHAHSYRALSWLHVPVSKRSLPITSPATSFPASPRKRRMHA